MKRFILASALAILASAVGATTVDNLKYDIAEQRIVVSCLDHRAPTVHVLNPASGPIVVIDCEREK